MSDTDNVHPPKQHEVRKLQLKSLLFTQIALIIMFVCCAVLAYTNLRSAGIISHLQANNSACIDEASRCLQNFKLAAGVASSCADQLESSVADSKEALTELHGCNTDLANLVEDAKKQNKDKSAASNRYLACLEQSTYDKKQTIIALSRASFALETCEAENQRLQKLLVAPFPTAQPASSH